MADLTPKESGAFIFRFLGDLWKLLSKRDKRILGNFWRGLVMATGDLYTRAYELDLSVAVMDMTPFSNSRWNKYVFNEDTLVDLVPSPISGYSYVHALGDSRIVSIPTLQDNVDDPTFTLKENVDYVIQNNFIYFNIDPLSHFPATDIYNHQAVLWARNTYFDKEIPYKNFGVLIDFYQTNSEQYLNIIRGLWYAYWTGPTPRNIKVALYLLFSLPVTLKEGVVTRRWEDEEGIKYVVVTEDDGNEEQYRIPFGLEFSVEIGDSVEIFDPLCTGIKVIDKMNTPGFIESELGREPIQRYLTQHATTGTGDTDETKAVDILEDAIWVPQVDFGVFEFPINIGDVRQFLRGIKPAYTDFISSSITSP